MNSLLLHLDSRAANAHRNNSTTKANSPTPAAGLDDFDSALKAASKPQQNDPASSDDSTKRIEAAPHQMKSRTERSPSKTRNSHHADDQTTTSDSTSADAPAEEPVATNNPHDDTSDASDSHEAPDDDSSEAAPELASASPTAALATPNAIPQTAAENPSPVHALPGVNVAAGIAQSLHLVHLAQQESGQQPGSPAAASPPATADTQAAPVRPTAVANLPATVRSTPPDSKTANANITNPSGDDRTYPVWVERPHHEIEPPGINQPPQPAEKPSVPQHSTPTPVLLRNSGANSPAPDAASSGQQQLAQAIATAVNASSVGSSTASLAESFNSSESSENPPKSDAASLLATTAPPAPATASASAETTAPAQDSPAPDAQNTFDQIVLGLRGKLDAKSGKADIRLEPPNLGTVRVSLSLDNGALTAQFQSSSDAVRNLLKDNMEKLKSVLQSQGVAVDKLAVDSPDAAAAAASPQQQSGQQNSFGSAAHDGRSAGEYRQEPRHRRSSDGETFARTLKANTDKVDLVA